ncbi:Hint domain-containing protein [Asaia krungthepensis]|uniref:Hedgehog/Intein (Hint) domain-containing protein n=1 Tax=Asaia krungthepensis NRIC 0535 TaxID=1307925 RepID=A0ABQ0Q130_9PROT|nr:Hint domain-containing protein [Asaia krungthepensis]GBQ86514.1 hypothetical protein AA0535_1040 [Asaia krungthepensis NRIC 0535]
MSISRSAKGAVITSGSTRYVSSGQTASNDVVYGLNGGTDHPAVDLASGGVISAATALSGGVIAAAANGTTYGGTAYESGSFAALNQGVVVSATITSQAGLAVGNLSGYQGDPARAIAPHVMNGGQAIVGGGFTVKGQSFSGSGVVSGGTFDVGSTEQLASGGTDSGSIFGGTQIVSSGALALRSIFSAGVQLVQGGLASSSVVSSGGVIRVGQGGTAVTVSVGPGGIAVALAGGVILNQIVMAAGAAIVSSGGVVSGATISSGGSEMVQSSGVVSGATILSGGTQVVQGGATVQNAAISAGGSMVVASGATILTLAIGGASTSTGPAGTLVVTPGAVLSNVTVGWRGRIDIEGLSYKPGGKITISGGTLTVTHTDGTSWFTPLTGSYKAGDFHLEADSDGSTELVYDKCFLAGTLIRTPSGERPVETLREGDLVCVLTEGRRETRRITWVGSTEIAVNASRPDDEAGYPVRLRADAFGPSVPDRDLFITPEHCICVDGLLVPARMLVNGESIAYDRSRTRFTIHHFRTEEHAIIWSNNLTTETLFDDGHSMGLLPVSPVPDCPTDREDRAAILQETPKRAAPLCVERNVVEALHRRLAARAGCLSLRSTRGTADQDPDLHLVAGDGQVIRPARRVNDMMIFHLPPDLDEVRLRSRASRPAIAEGPFVDDRRDLGVLVGDVHIWDSNGMTRLDAHLCDEMLEGWYGLEEAPARWTGGNARLPLGARSFSAPGVLGITIKGIPHYEPVSML